MGVSRERVSLVVTRTWVREPLLVREHINDTHVVPQGEPRDP